MKITINRILIAVVLVYFPIATLGSTGSWLRAAHELILLLVVLWLGYQEAKMQAQGERG